MEALYMVTLRTNSPNESLSQQTVQEDDTVPQLVLAWLMLHRCSRYLQSMKTNCGRALLFRSCSLHFSRCLPRQDSSNPAHARLHRYVSREKGWHMCRSNNDALKNGCYGRVDHDEGEAWKISVVLKKGRFKTQTVPSVQHRQKSSTQTACFTGFWDCPLVAANSYNKYISKHAVRRTNTLPCKKEKVSLNCLMTTK